MGLSPMVEDVKPDSEICRLDYDSQLFRFSNILSVVCFISHVILDRGSRLEPTLRAVHSESLVKEGIGRVSHFGHIIENLSF